MSLALTMQRATNALGPVSPEVSERVVAVVLNPTAETWDRAYTAIVNGEKLTTLWQAVRHVDPNCPNIKVCAPNAWDGYVPTSFTIRRALEAAVAGEVSR